MFFGVQHIYILRVCEASGFHVLSNAYYCMCGIQWTVTILVAMGVHLLEVWICAYPVPNVEQLPCTVCHANVY